MKEDKDPVEHVIEFCDDLMASGHVPEGQLRWELGRAMEHLRDAHARHRASPGVERSIAMLLGVVCVMAIFDRITWDWLHV